MRRLLPLLAFVIACGSGEKQNTDITHHTPLASYRVLALVSDQPAIDVVVTVKDEVPGTIGNVASPGISAFSQLPAGLSKVFALVGGKPIAEADATTQEGGTFTVTVTGGGTGVKLAVVPESLAAAPGKARVRFIDASSAGVTSAKIGTEELPLGTTQPGDWKELAPADPAKLEIAVNSGPLASFSTLSLGDGSVTTLSLVGPPLRLLVVRENASGPATSQLVDPDGTVKPKAQVRFLNASEDAGDVDFAGESGPSLASGVAFKHVSADAEVVTDAVLHAAAGGTELASETLALDPAKTYTIALIGRKTGTIPLKLVAWEDQRQETTAPTARLAIAVPGMPGTLALTKDDQSPLLPATAYATVSPYTEVPAGPLDAIAQLAFGPQTQPIAKVPGLVFPATHAVTLVAVGTLAQPPAQTTLSVLVLDDHDGTIVDEKTPQPLPTP